MEILPSLFQPHFPLCTFTNVAPKWVQPEIVLKFTSCLINYGPQWGANGLHLVASTAAIRRHRCPRRRRRCIRLDTKKKTLRIKFTPFQKEIPPSPRVKLGKITGWRRHVASAQEKQSSWGVTHGVCARSKFYTILIHWMAGNDLQHFLTLFEEI